MPLKRTCFMQPCAQEPVLFVLETLPELVVCKSHAMQVLNDLREAGFKDAYLKAISAVHTLHVPIPNPHPERRRNEKAPPEYRLSIPYTELPMCVLAQPDEPRHRRGILRVTAKLVGNPVEMRVCVDCLADLTTNLRQQGDYTEIRVIAPELKQVTHLPE